MKNEEEEDTDTDEEISGDDKFLRTFRKLLTNGSDDEESSDSDDSSIYEDEGLELTPEHNVQSRN